MRICFFSFKTAGRKIFIPLLLLVLCIISFSCKTPSKNQSASKNPKQLPQEEQLYLTALYIDGIREYSLENYDKALGLFSQCVKRKPDYAPALFEMAKILDMQHEYNDALTMATGAVKIEPENEWYQKLLSDIYINLRDYNSAAKIIKPLSDKRPNDIDLAYDLADLYVFANKYTDAIKVYDGIEKVYGVSEETSLQKEKLYLGMGKVNKAIDEIESLTKSYPGEVRYLGMLAELYMSSGNSIKAFEIYEKMKTIDPGDPYVHLSLADYYRAQNNNEKSFEELKLAFENPKLDIDNKIRILMQYFSSAATDTEIKQQAYRLNEIVVRVHPSYAKGWSMYGDFLYRDKRYEEARNAFRKVTSIDSSKFVVWEQLIAIESMLNDYPAMLNESDRALALFPEQAETYLYNGFANMHLNHTADALRSLKTGLNYTADNELIIKFQNSLGDAYFKDKNFNASFDAFEKALKLDPKNTYALNNYSYYLALQKQNLARAAELAAKLNELVKDDPSYEDTYGWVLFRQDNFADARTWIEKALAHGGSTNADILEHYGDVLFKLNDKTNALLFWQKAKDAGGNTDILQKKINDKNWYE